MDQAFFDAAAARLRHATAYEIDRSLPVWARRSNPIVRRQLGSYWKTLTPDVGTLARVYLAQVAFLGLTILVPALFTLLMPTVTVTLVLLPIGLVMYGQILYAVGASAAKSVVAEQRNETLDLLRIIPRPTIHLVYSKVAAAVWRHTENLSMILVGTALASLPLMIIQYDIYFSLDRAPMLLRAALALALLTNMIRIILEPLMVGAVGALVGAAMPVRVPAVVVTTVFTAAYFFLINFARFAPIGDAGHILIEIVLPVLLPLIITYVSLRAANALLTRD